ncbi:MAG: ABC transporter ATP-binding protein [bacterium]|nr:ABC transporter ATP-binding protein [bacterium]MDY2649962.1 ABC transporter ATP-binding protein [Candidatus Egerieousia sp.]
MKSLGYCIRNLVSFSRSARIWGLAYILLGIIRTLLSLTFVWVCKELVDIATGVSQEPLGQWTAFMIACIVLQICCRIASSYCEQYGRINIQNNLRAKLFYSLISSRWSGRERFGTGDAVNRLEEDIRVVSELVSSHIPAVVVTFAQLAAASTFLLFISPNLLWALVGLMIAGIIASRLSFRKLRSLSTAIRTKDGEIQQHIQEHLQNRVVALTIIGIERVMATLNTLHNALRYNTIKRLNFHSLNSALLSVSFMGGYAAAFLWGVYGIKSGTVTFGMMTAFLQLVSQIQMPLSELARKIPAFIHALSSIERLAELENLDPEENAPLCRLDAPAGILFKDVTFSYPDSHSGVLFNSFSHNFLPGTMTVVAGATGIGKSTLVRLMLGLLKPQSGSILIYGSSSNLQSASNLHDVASLHNAASQQSAANSHYASKATRCNFKYVPQGNTLLSGTILDNLLMADPKAERERIDAALHIAAADFVHSLPEGLQTICGESGSGLSEGQCQRIAIARALLHSGSVLLMDESTSSLDPATESLVLQNLRTLSNHTIIFISHREAVMKSADSLLEL